MTQLVRIINPNSNAAVTAGMSEAVDCLRRTDGPRLDCVTIAEGPLGVETLQHVMQVEPLLRDAVVNDAEADAFVLGVTAIPVFTSAGKPPRSLCLAFRKALRC